MFIECYHKVHKDQEVQGFLDYHSCADLENIISYNVSEVLEDNDIIYNNEIDYLCIYAHGSRVFGNPGKNSDIDFVLFYKGSIREDDLFNIFVDENIYIEHIKCDFNPIQIDDNSDIEYYIQKHDIEYYQHPLMEKKHNLALALDDLEDMKDNSSVSSDIIDTDDVIRNKLQLEKYFVDLGLPSKTLWCKFNLGCDKRFDYNRYKHEYCDNKADWYGDYYAWGDLNGLKNEYTADNYAHAQHSGYANIYYMTSKYAYNKLTQLLSEDDPAYQKIKINNFKFHTPTKEQAEELIDNTSHEWKTNYLGYEGLNGMLLKSKNNDNFIFLPATGIYNGDKLKDNNIWGVYWTSDLSNESDSEAHCFWFDKYDIYKPHFANHTQRYLGLQIRPVHNKNNG